MTSETILSTEPTKPIPIDRPRLVVAEGLDAKIFLIWALSALGVRNTQVLDSGGIANLRNYLEVLVLQDGWKMVESLIVARDAETDCDSALDQVNGALRAASLAVPPGPFEFVDGSPRIAVMLFPGPDARSGTLEHLCLQIVTAKPSAQPLLKCVDRFVDCVESTGQDVKRPHKVKLHTFLSAQDRFVGLKVGEAAKVGAWDWEHPAFEPFRRLLSERH